MPVESRSPTDGPPVISRLQALFGPSSPSGRSSRASFCGENGSPTPSTPVEPSVAVHRAISEPVAATLGERAKHREVRDRNALVVKLVTWNMGDALPKGDLSVLLGHAPEYTPLTMENGFPLTPVADAHPYHIVVVAGQECPTESGVPRGLGGGVIRGMKLGQQLRKEKRDKGKDKEEKEELHDIDDESKGDAPLDQPPRFALEDPGESGESTEASRAASPALAHTPTLHRHGHQAGVKGWSSMLDDWLCGPAPKPEQKEEKEKDATSKSARPSDATSPDRFPHLSHLRVDSPLMQRSASSPLALGAASSPSPSSSPSPTPGFLTPTPHANNNGTHHSPLARSPGSFTSLASSSETSDSELESAASHVASSQSHAASLQPLSTSGPSRPQPVSLPSSPRKPKADRPERPELLIPRDDPATEGTKCYIHLAKQRLMGMYLSIYVHKDCRDLVQGLDKDFVTTGLAGGRLGNKGGIGISLKIADHRFLFVNSHLAAHTARNAARVANIAKIKAELSLDCFLPRTDPRAGEEDIADRFDTVFWCGDLNFRLDVSRLHAEWLVEQKKYDEALTFDQLKVVMADPDKTPFSGFDEGLINFPPTFKYDVWKSARATNRELRRSIKRRNSVKERETPMQTSVTASTLGHVPEGDTERLSDEDGDESARRSEDVPRLHADELLDPPRRSSDSMRSVRSAVPSINLTDDEGHSIDLARRDDQAVRNGMANSHRPLDVTLKEKTKKVFSLVKLKTALSSSPARKDKDKIKGGKDASSGRSRGSTLSAPSPVPPSQSRWSPEPPDLREFDAASRRTSLSSLASARDAHTFSDIGSPRDSEDGAQAPSGGVRRRANTSNRPRAGTLTSTKSGQGGSGAGAGLGLGASPGLQGATSPMPIPSGPTSPPPSGRGRSFSLKRTMSGRSAKFGVGSMGGSEEGVGEEDTREGVYDSSKKQRVPSWCDRVLWKAHPIPDPPEPVLDEAEREALVDSALSDRPRGLGRLSQAFHNFGGHIKRDLALSRTPSLEPVAQDGPLSRVRTNMSGMSALRRVRTRRGSGGDGGEGPLHDGSRADGRDSITATPTLFDSPPSSPELGVRDGKGAGLVPLPRDSSATRSRTPDIRLQHDRPNPARARALTFDDPPIRSRSPRSPTGMGSHRHPLLEMPSSGSLGGAGSGLGSGAGAGAGGTGDAHGVAARPRITFDPASADSPSALAKAEGPEPLGETARKPRPRANSDCLGVPSAKARLAVSLGLGPARDHGRDGHGGDGDGSGSGSMKSSPSFPPVRRRLTDEVPRRAVPIDSLPDSALSGPGRAGGNAHNVRLGPPAAAVRSAPAPRPMALYEPEGDDGRSHLHAHAHSSGSNTHASSSNAFARFLKDLPGWLHRHATGGGRDDAAGDGDGDGGDGAEGNEVDGRTEKVKRHMQGEVVCLGYGTIDDAGMRALEGRSDHRPAIFAAAVYI